MSAFEQSLINVWNQMLNFQNKHNTANRSQQFQPLLVVVIFWDPSTPAADKLMAQHLFFCLRHVKILLVGVAAKFKFGEGLTKKAAPGEGEGAAPSLGPSLG